MIHYIAGILIGLFIGVVFGVLTTLWALNKIPQKVNDSEVVFDDYEEDEEGNQIGGYNYFE